MTLSQRTTEPLDVGAAVGRVENWLLHSGIQLDCGAHRGAVAGWLDRDGRPAFVYLEITGYYVTAMRWLSSGAASSPEHTTLAGRRARRAAEWIATLVESEPVPPTRLYLSGDICDWRNNAAFSFDLAMAARGVAHSPLHTRQHGRRALATISTMISRISAEAAVMASHGLVDPDTTVVPDRWSTQPGVHHLKAAAALLRLPKHITGDTLIAMAQRTCERWSGALMADDWPCQELHPLLYGLEGMLLSAQSPGELLGVERAFAQLMQLQSCDGTLPETAAGGKVRSDVLAQALRIGLLLRGRGYLTDPVWTDRLDRLARALVDFVRPDGGVLFSADQTIANAWCAMFAHQALYLYACDSARDAVPARAYDLLV